MNKIVKILAVFMLVVALAGAGCIDEVPDAQPTTQEEVPTVVLENSLERQLINKWIEEVGDVNNIMWVYHFSDTGQLIAEYPVVGKPVSMTKSNEPYERTVKTQYSDGRDDRGYDNFEGYRAGTTQLANPSGTYGHDLEGVFFFTPDGSMVIIQGGIIVTSTVPRKFTTPVFLTHDIDYEKQQKEKMWEEQLKNGTIKIV